MPELRFLIALDYDLALLGGAQRAALLQAAALARAGCTVDVVAPQTAGADAAFSGIVGGLPVGFRPFPHRGLVPGVGLPVIVADPVTRARAAGLVEGMDVVLVHSEFGLASVVVEAAKRRGIPVLHTVHTAFWRAPRLASPFAPALARVLTAVTGASVAVSPGHGVAGVLRAATYAASGRADAVLSPSRHQAEVLRRAGVARVRVLSNTVEDARVRPYPDVAGLRLVWAGRNAPEKRLGVALDGTRAAAATLPRGHVGLEVAGPARRRVGAAPGVRGHGRVAASAVGRLIDGSHAALITSLGFDNQPLAALEAFCRGRPVIVSDPALAREFGNAAILTAGPDAHGLAATIRALAGDPAPLRFAAAAALQLGAAASPESHVAGLFAVLTELGVRVTAHEQRRAAASIGDNGV